MSPEEIRGVTEWWIYVFKIISSNLSHFYLYGSGSVFEIRIQIHKGSEYRSKLDPDHNTAFEFSAISRFRGFTFSSSPSAPDVTPPVSPPLPQVCDLFSITRDTGCSAGSAASCSLSRSWGWFWPLALVSLGLFRFRDIVKHGFPATRALLLKDRTDEVAMTLGTRRSEHLRSSSPVSWSSDEVALTLGTMCSEHASSSSSVSSDVGVDVWCMSSSVQKSDCEGFTWATKEARSSSNSSSMDSGPSSSSSHEVFTSDFTTSGFGSILNQTSFKSFSEICHRICIPICL